MTEISWEMDFVNLMNPLYALPIVAVIICAVVVYAFGFRSVQPPSFEEIEVEKKGGRKRRQKESQKARNQSEKNSNISKKIPDAATSNKSAKKGKVDKSRSNEEIETKPIQKTKRKVVEKLSPSVDHTMVTAEDDNDDGWKICPSGKKGKKKRKPDDAVIIETSTSENSAAEFTHGAENAENLVPTSDGNQQCVSESILNENVLNDSKADNKPLHGKKSSKSSAKVSLAEIENVIAEEELIHEYIDVKLGLNQVKEGKPTLAKTQKKKKKNEHVNENIEVTAEIPTEFKEIIQENKSLNHDEQAIGDDSQKVEDKVTKKSNAVSELEVLNQKETQKKKKSKARRDH